MGRRREVCNGEEGGRYVMGRRREVCNGEEEGGM